MFVYAVQCFIVEHVSFFILKFNQFIGKRCLAPVDIQYTE
jgi:hypothetical protein